jgi:hypothetical protein
MDTSIITTTPAAIARIQTVTDAADLARKAELAARIFEAIRDKHENAQKARAVWLLAVRRGGELLLEIPRENGGRPRNTFELQLVTLYQEAKESAGVSDFQAQVWQRLAEIPRDTMERYLHDPRYQLGEYSVNGLMTFAYGKRKPAIQTLQGALKMMKHFARAVADRDDFGELPADIKARVLDLLALFDERYYDVV